MFPLAADKKKNFVEQRRVERQQREQERLRVAADERREAAAVVIQRWWRRRRPSAQVDLWAYWDSHVAMVQDDKNVANDAATREAVRLLQLYARFSGSDHEEMDVSRLSKACALLHFCDKTHAADDAIARVLVVCLVLLKRDDPPGVALTTLLRYLKPPSRHLDRVFTQFYALGEYPHMVFAASVRVERLVKQEKRSLDARDHKWIKSAKLWLASVTRLWLFPVEAQLSDANHYLADILALPLIAMHLPAMLRQPLANHTRQFVRDVVAGGTTRANGVFRQTDARFDGNAWLFLLGNMVSLLLPGQLDAKDKEKGGKEDENDKSDDYEDVLEVAHNVVSVVLAPHFSGKQHGAFRHYHPVFKWAQTATLINAVVFDALEHQQIAQLWSRHIVDHVVAPPILHWAVLPRIKVTLAAQRAFSLYAALGRSLPHHWNTILTRLAFSTNLMPALWHAMHQFGPQGAMRIYYQAANKGVENAEKEPLMDVLKVFCDTCSLVFLTLDEMDLFQKQKPFSVQECIDLSGFLNQFFFALLQHLGTADAFAKYASVRRLLLQLYDLDSRHAFCPRDHWILVSSSSSSEALIKKHPLLRFLFNHGQSAASSAPSQQLAASFLAQVRQGDAIPLQILQTMPHTISFRTRLAIFRDWIHMDKQHTASAAPVACIVPIRRASLLHDGLRAMRQLSTTAWKGTVRIAFVNQLGVDEAGIDQGGPFKDFVTLLVNEVLHPKLGLFVETKDTHLLYPSSASNVAHPNHLELFELIGKVVGKAVYEGILLDCQFARFFLAKLLGRNVFLEALKELDEDVWKNLIFLKHYEGDATDLGLTFAMDEIVFGKVISKELKYRGQHLSVTNSNKLEYVYLVADHKLNQQARDQTDAFIQGFRSIISSAWLRIFTPTELQWIISGEDLDFDVLDLRRNTQYQNGYFDQHPIIKMLWSIVEGFSSDDKRAFLKFITGCPKPPLGGAEYFSPPFTIRLVSMDEQQQQQQQGVRMVKAMLKLGNASQEKTGRLPSSSTCFNLLKLPAFTKKAVLRDKLRYAIHANAGFELS